MWCGLLIAILTFPSFDLSFILFLQASRSATPSGRTSPGEDSATKSTEAAKGKDTEVAAPESGTATGTAAAPDTNTSQDPTVTVKREIKIEQNEGDFDEGADVFSQVVEDEEGEEEVEDESKVKAALQTGLLGKGVAEEERRMAAESKR